MCAKYQCDTVITMVSKSHSSKEELRAVHTISIDTQSDDCCYCLQGSQRGIEIDHCERMYIRSRCVVYVLGGSTL